MSGRTGGPSIIEVAREAGVSTATAGRVLGGYGSPSEQLRIRVFAAAHSLGYEANALARSVVTGRSGIVGVVVPDIGNPFFARALRGISDVLRQAGLEVVLANTDGDVEVERRAVEVMSRNRVAGLILASVSLRDGRHLTKMLSRGVPVVLLDREIEGLDEVDSVMIDNRLAARRAVGHLIGLGHRRIAVVTEATKTLGPALLAGGVHAGLPSLLRLEGYLDAFREHGTDLDLNLIRYSGLRREESLVVALDLLSTDTEVTAIFCTSNVMTLGTLEAIQQSGRRCPDDVSLVGFDDLEWTSLVRPRLTVVAQPTYDLGATAANRLLARLNGESNTGQRILLTASLIIRESAAAAPETAPPGLP
jgi:LacI family transcriptional regulator